MRDIVEVIRKDWGWFLAFGIFLVLLGSLAVGSATFTTLFTVTFLGALLLIAGVTKVIHSLWARKSDNFGFSLLTGLLYGVTGGLILWNPATSAIALTLLIATLFIVSGIAKMLGSALIRFSEWGWVFFSGLVSLVLGGLILAEWPVSGLWVIGLFVGIDLIIGGWAWIITSLTARRFPQA